MKKLCALLMTACMLLGLACAEDVSERGKQGALDMLTEVYGYTVEETAGFQFESTEEGERLQVRFWPLTRPEWVYTAVFNTETGKYMEGSTPFLPGNAPQGYPGESAIREVLREGEAQNWFRYWNSSGRNEMLLKLRKLGIQPNSELSEGIVAGNISGGAAIRAFFETCYGSESAWPDPVREWYKTTLIANEVEETARIAFAEGTTTYTYQIKEYFAPTKVTRFTSGEAPEAVQALTRHPKLAGWQALCGVLRENEASETLHMMDDDGLVIFEKEGQRLLVLLERAKGDTEWTLYPISQSALRTEGKVYIEAENTAARTFYIVYPLSETESERFMVRQYSRNTETCEGKQCALVEYSRMDTATGEGFWLKVESYGAKVIVYHADGRIQEEEVVATIPQTMDRLDVDTFPTTLTQCWQMKTQELPEDEAICSGVHLRASKSSRSRDLGMYEDGVRVKILSEEPGDPYNWYRVQVGGRQGYMCSNYVHQSDTAYLLNHCPPIGKTTREVKLKNGTGLLARTVQTLPEGTRFHVLAECGDKLHVMLMEGESAALPVNGTDGYVSKKDVIVAWTALQLDWL